MRTQLSAITLAALLSAVTVYAEPSWTVSVCEGQATITEHVVVDEQGAYLVHFEDHEGNESRRFPFPNEDKLSEGIADVRAMIVESYLDMHRHYAALGVSRALRGC